MPSDSKQMLPYLNLLNTFAEYGQVKICNILHHKQKPNVSQKMKSMTFNTGLLINQKPMELVASKPSKPR